MRVPGPETVQRVEAVRSLKPTRYVQGVAVKTINRSDHLGLTNWRRRAGLKRIQNNRDSQQPNCIYLHMPVLCET